MQIFMDKEVVDPYSVSALYIYPIKSCQGITIKNGRANNKGFVGDREYMLVDENGKFITQRNLPQMAQIKVEKFSKGLKVNAPGMDELTIPKKSTGKLVPVNLWKDNFRALKLPELLSQWFSEFLKRKVTLVKQSTKSKRKVSEKYALSKKDQVSLADGYPFLIVTNASLRKLNEYIIEPKIPVTRFRPNIVIEGKFPFNEDYWGIIKIGGVELALVKSCMRCVITTVDQKIGQRINNEPLFTLSKIRRTENGVNFGQNAIPINTGIISVGDNVEILKQK